MYIYIYIYICILVVHDMISHTYIIGMITVHQRGIRKGRSGKMVMLK